jgi:hypothetical protein
MALRIHNNGSRWWGVDSLNPCPLYPGKEAWYPLDGKLGERQVRLEHFAYKHALSLLPGPGVFLEAAASPRSYRVQAHKHTCVCPQVEEVHARKWKLYAPTQDVA